MKRYFLLAGIFLGLCAIFSLDCLPREDNSNGTACSSNSDCDQGYYCRSGSCALDSGGDEIDECPNGSDDCPADKPVCVEFDFGPICLVCLDDSKDSSPDCGPGEWCSVTESGDSTTAECVTDCTNASANPCASGSTCNAETKQCQSEGCDLNCPENSACQIIDGEPTCVCDLDMDISGCTCPGNSEYYPEYGCIDDGYFDINKSNEWYKTQMGTGPADDVNCGPTSVYMSIQWTSPNNDVTVEEIRNLHPNYNQAGGYYDWWYTTDIDDALHQYLVNHQLVDLTGAPLILDTLKKGHPLLICVNMSYITNARSPKSTHFNRFYTGVTGHFLIIKGYIDDGEWLMVYDPNNWEDDYYDTAKTEPLGKDRYYKTSEVVLAMQNHWNYFFEIGTSTMGKPRFDVPVAKAGPVE